MSLDDAPFQTLVLNEVEAVHRLAYHLCRDPHEAEDAVQETYLRALRAAGLYQHGGHGVRPWLFKILHNVLHTRRSRDRRTRDTLKRFGERRPRDETDAGASYPSVTNPNGATPATVALDWDALDERLCAAIRLLPLAHRTVFLLAAVEDLKYREIADVVGVPVGTVMSRLSRARTALAGQLQGLAAERNLRRAPAGIDEALGGQKS